MMTNYKEASRFSIFKIIKIREEPSQTKRDKELKAASGIK